MEQGLEDTIAGLSSHYDVSDAQKQAYRENGHVYLPGVFSGTEVAAYREQILDATAEMRSVAPNMSKRDTYGKAFLQMSNLWTQHEGVKAFTLCRRCAQISAELMGVEGTRMYHDQALFKEAGGGFTPWHQDQYYWPLDTERTITMWMPMVDLAADMGIMRFGSRSHVSGYLPEMGAISDDSEIRIDEYVKQHGYDVVGESSMKAGDATFHSGWTLHRAPGNSSGTDREVMTIIYYPDGTTILPPDSPAREVDLRSWLDSGTPGELAQGPLNPLLYP